MNKTTNPCFSNGSEAAMWIDRNCDRCVKSARLKVNNVSHISEYTKSRCKIWDEIGEQWLGYGNEPVSLRTYDATQRLDCPYRQEHWPKRKKIMKKDKNQLELGLWTKEK